MGREHCIGSACDAICTMWRELCCVMVSQQGDPSRGRGPRCQRKMGRCREQVAASPGGGVRAPNSADRLALVQLWLTEHFKQPTLEQSWLRQRQAL